MLKIVCDVMVMGVLWRVKGVWCHDDVTMALAASRRWLLWGSLRVYYGDITVA